MKLAVWVVVIESKVAQPVPLQSAMEPVDPAQMVPAPATAGKFYKSGPGWLAS